MSDVMTKLGGKELAKLSLEKYAMACRIDCSKYVHTLAFACKAELERRLAKLERLEKENQRLKARLKKFTQAKCLQEFPRHGVQM